ncbi:MAG: DUF3795 domain-containing protein [Candidatus Bathyarchaeota archaeon]|nr:DUF3795 domain-containing protein [Candidatus Bathyarchaeota archaeon]
MSDLVSKCGLNCGACPWGPNPRKGMSAEDFERYRKNAKQILGYMPIKTPCVTCQTPDAEIPKESKLPSRTCLIRQCVDKAGVANCAYCQSFPCDTLKETAAAWTREKIEAKLGAQISEEKYHLFVEPFEGIKRLAVIRASLKADEFVEPAKSPSSETRTVDFPKNLPLSKKEAASFKAVHNLLSKIELSSLGLSSTDTFAQQHKLENLRTQLLRFLWIFGNYGKFENTKSLHLVVDAETYLANRGTAKKLAIWSFVEDTVFKVLNEFGVCCERVAITGAKIEDLTTGTGYLRKKGWVISLSFKEKIGETEVLKAFQLYSQKLDEKFGKNAFKQFSNADMQFLTET